jgi:hypothetical protein
MKQVDVQAPSSQSAQGATATALGSASLAQGAYSQKQSQSGEGSEFGKSKDKEISQVKTEGAMSIKPAEHTVSQHKADDLLPVGTAGGLAATQAQSPTVSASERREVIQNIMNQAEVLAQKGGGEMKMVLKPDHLGEIQLHVAMEGNQVEVKMTTDNQQAKQLIESHAADLRHGLSQHSFSMEKLDVSVGDRNTGNFNQGRQPDMGAARDFSSQLSNQGQNRREQVEVMSELRGLAPKLGRPQMASTPLMRPNYLQGNGLLNVRA